MPKLEIVGVETMLIADRLMGEMKSEQVSAVNLLFMAPECWNETETKEYKFDERVDVWSIGRILYLLITGGKKQKFKEEFSFDEEIW